MRANTVICQSDRCIKSSLVTQQMSISYINVVNNEWAVHVRHYEKMWGCVTIVELPYKSSTFFIAILNGTCSLHSVITMKTFQKHSKFRKLILKKKTYLGKCPIAAQEQILKSHLFFNVSRRNTQQMDREIQ